MAVSFDATAFRRKVDWSLDQRQADVGQWLEHDHRPHLPTNPMRAWLIHDSSRHTRLRAATRLIHGPARTTTGTH